MVASAVIRSMDEHLVAAGQSIRLRHTVNRWLEYSFFMGFMTVVAFFIVKWQGWSYVPALVPLMFAVCLMAVACFYNLALVESQRREATLVRAQRKRRNGK
ncbi:MAG: hypothetical protein E6I63_11340 [Chloroflexi bacterium]|nr:MAG: hypothetical protein E6I63_11340 [Chloroflexota bacterium]